MEAADLLRPTRAWATLRRNRASTTTRHPQPRGTVPSLVSSGYVRVVPDRLAAHMRTMLAADEAYIHARDPSDPEALIVVAGCGCDPELVGSRVAADSGVAGLALTRGQPAVAGGTNSKTRELAAAAAPVARDGRLAGAVSVVSRDPSRAFGLDQLERLCEVAELAGGGLKRPAARRALERTAEVQTASLATAAELWDASTGAHAKRVVELARQCGDRLRLSSAELLEVELAALLHDVGKIRLPRELLSKPGPLTEEERQVVRLHSTWGAELVAQVPGLAAVALLVRHHHERMDGSGYPAGLSGNEVPLAARIVAAADAYAAMTAGRAYRSAIPPANAIEELRVHAGEQFDPDVVDALANAVGARGVVVPLPLAATA